MKLRERGAREWEERGECTQGCWVKNTLEWFFGQMKKNTLDVKWIGAIEKLCGAAQFQANDVEIAKTSVLVFI